MSDQGLKAVFSEVRPMLLRLLVARLGNREDAEDALQDLWFKIDQLGDRPIAQPAAFLYRAAANLATDRRIAGLRRNARETGWLDVQPQGDEYPDAERALIARERLARVEAAMAAMPERMRTALILFRFEGRPQREIAEQLGITVSGVEKLLRRAYRQIHDASDMIGAETGLPHRIGDEGNANDA
ncbi:MAG: sigma-70 family RNA polymerase sigma factor [Pseudomonadota bacterium]